MSVEAQRQLRRDIIALFTVGPEIPEAAIENLIAHGAEVEESLVAIISSDEVVRTSWATVWATVALGEMKSEKAIPALLRLLAGEGGDVDSEAAEEALINMGRPALRPTMRYIEEELAQGTGDGRIYAYSVLAHNEGRDEESFQFLLRMLQEDQELAYVICSVLAELGDPRALEAMQAALERCRRQGPRKGRGYWDPCADMEESIAILKGEKAMPEFVPSFRRPWRERWRHLAKEEEVEREERQPPPPPPPPPAPQPVRVSKIPRNAPCPCGSGKKYKKCCGLSA